MTIVIGCLQGIERLLLPFKSSAVGSFWLTITISSWSSWAVRAETGLRSRFSAVLTDCRTSSETLFPVFVTKALLNQDLKFPNRKIKKSKNNKITQRIRKAKNMFPTSCCRSFCRKNLPSFALASSYHMRWRGLFVVSQGIVVLFEMQHGGGRKRLLSP